MLHWKEIKGFYGTSASPSDILYTYIKFQKSNTDATLNRPHIVLNSDDLGYIVTNLTDNVFNGHQTLNYSKALRFNVSGLPSNFSQQQYDIYTSSCDIIGHLPDWGRTSSSGTIYTPRLILKQGSYRNSSTRYDDYLLQLCADYSYLRTSRFFIDAWTHYSNTICSAEAQFSVKTRYILNEFSARSGLPGKFQIYSHDGNNTYVNYIHVGATDDTGYYYRFLPNGFTSTQAINALYFNATSDLRAKKDLKLVERPVLDLINNVPVYTFKYKDTNVDSLGIIAQDLKDIKLNNFELIDNLQATGENDDFMHIRESKLVYVLWKAVQELSAEVAQLKKELNK